MSDLAVDMVAHFRLVLDDDADTAELILTPPRGLPMVFTLAGGTIDHTDLGSYHVAQLMTKAGQWLCEWVTTLAGETTRAPLPFIVYP